jgi:hypothetical protein
MDVRKGPSRIIYLVNDKNTATKQTAVAEDVSELNVNEVCVQNSYALC